ncbi:hypothetical protein [Myroides fluvii]|uniref:hypothetical protein n=1 Tax=Myroides fluvii TaxID=2572594 RepID=UPI00131CE6EB|nr:hypothetical protein [Myroides fluvii]
MRDAKDYLNTQRKGWGKKFLIQYRETLKSLQQNPHFQIRYKDIHCLPLPDFKYMIHFKVNETKKEIHVYAVLSTHLNPKENWL